MENKTAMKIDNLREIHKRSCIQLSISMAVSKVE